MKHLILCCCLLLSAQYVCAQKIFKKKKGEYSYTNPDGNRESGMLVNHLQEGEWITYYGKTKDIKIKTTYVHGEATGKTEEYNRSGKLTASGYYRDGYADSAWTYYYSTGEVSETRTYSKGKLHGDLNHYANGLIFKHYRFEQNEMTSFEAFDYTGKPLMGEYYKNGQKHGRCWNTKYWDNPDSLHRNYCDYVNDKKHGEEKGKGIYGSENIVTRHWTNGVLEGPYTLYDENGNLIEEGNYHNGYAIGHWKSYYSEAGQKLLAEHWYSAPTAKDSAARTFYRNNLHGARKQFPDSVKLYEKDGKLRQIEIRQNDNSYEAKYFYEAEQKQIAEVDTNGDYRPNETLPEFPGGEQALTKFLQLNVQYPKAAYDAGIQGTVYVRFAVDRDGEVVNEELVKSVHPLLDKEAMRVISIMPKWKPGTQNGKPVRVIYSLPIKFTRY